MKSKDRVYIVEENHIMGLFMEHSLSREFSKIGFENLHYNDLEIKISEEGYEGIKAVFLDNLNFYNFIEDFGDEFKSRKIPYILDNSGDLREEKNAIEKYGAFDYLHKPFKGEDIVGLFKRVLEYSSKNE